MTSGNMYQFGKTSLYSHLKLLDEEGKGGIVSRQHM